jgi:hypothetical protein
MRLRHVRVKGRRGEVLQAGTIIGRPVLVPRDVGGAVVVTVVSLVVTGDLAEVGGCPRRRDRAFALAGDGGGVVAEGLKGGVAHRELVSDHVRLGDGCGLLEVAVGDTAARVG